MTISLALISVVAFSACNKSKSSETSSPQSSVNTKDVYTGPYSGPADSIANTKAEVGGVLTTWGGEYPKSLNYWLDPNSFSGEVMGLLYEPLAQLHSTQNEAVGVLAESWTISDDKKTFIFKLNPQAKWSDGHALGAEDVQFYYDVIQDPKNLTPIFKVGLSRFERPEVIDSVTLKVVAKEVHWSNFWEVAGMMAFPKHVWEKQNFNDMHFDFSVVSGPYKIKEIKQNRVLNLERRNDWWGRVKAWNLHKYNFAEIRYKFMADQIKVLEAFKKGDLDVYPVYTAKLWVHQTDFEATQKNWVIKQKIFNEMPKGFQGYAFNLRKEKFQDPKVRKALAFLYNRDLMNEKLMDRQYFMLNSFYPDLYKNDSENQFVQKYNLDSARILLAQAGYKVNAKGILEKNGKPFEITFLESNPDLRHLNLFVEDLKKVGILAKIDQLSQSSIRKKVDQFDFDLHQMAFGGSRLRDPEPMWQGAQAKVNGSANIAGVQDRQIDSLIQAQKSENDLNKRNQILKAIDQRLLAIQPFILSWANNNTRLLYWNKFSTPQYVLDKYNGHDMIVTYWSENTEKNKSLVAAKSDKKALESNPSEVYWKANP